MRRRTVANILCLVFGIGVIALADGVKNNGALVKFDVSVNTLNAEGCEAIAKALKDNDTLTELNISKNNMFVKEFDDQPREE